MVEIVDPFHRALRRRLEVELQNRVQALAGGGASVAAEDRSTVAEKYAAQVAYIMALREVLDICDELGNDLYGERYKQDDGT